MVHASRHPFHPSYTLLTNRKPAATFIATSLPHTTLSLAVPSLSTQAETLLPHAPRQSRHRCSEATHQKPATAKRLSGVESPSCLSNLLTAPQTPLSWHQPPCRHWAHPSTLCSCEHARSATAEDTG